MIKEKIQQDLILAIKQNNDFLRDTLRLLSNGLTLAEKEKREPLDEKEEIEVLRRAAKQRKEAAEAYEKGNRAELAAKENKELEIITQYLPQELSDEEIERIARAKIQETGATEISQMGKVIGAVMGETKGKADGAKVAQIVKKILSQQ